jgi:hypothetical protein
MQCLKRALRARHSRRCTVASKHCECTRFFFSAVYPLYDSLFPSLCIWYADARASLVLFHPVVGGMAPALIASIIPLLPVISHFAFDFVLDASDILRPATHCRLSTAAEHQMVSSSDFDYTEA